MAIFIKDQPQNFTPVYNEVITVLDSTNNTKPNFKYIIDINVNGNFSSRLPVDPNLQGFGIVDISKHIASYVYSNLDHTDTDTFQLMTDSFAKFDIDLFEEYRVDLTFATVSDNGGFVQYNFAQTHYLSVGNKINVTGSSVTAYDGVQEVTAVPSTTAVVTTTPYSATATGDAVIFDGSSTLIPSATVYTGDKFAINVKELWKNFPDWDYSDYDLGSNSKKFLTTLTSGQTFANDDRFWANIFYNTSGQVRYLEVTTDNGTFRIENDTHTTSSDTTKFLTLGVGPWNLENTTNPVTVLLGSLPMFDENTTFYRLQLQNVSGTPISETISLNIKNECSKWEQFRMIYLDRFGSFQSARFGLASDYTLRTSKTTYKKNYGAFNAATNTWGYNTWDRGDTTLTTDITERYKIRTDYITELQAEQVFDLLQSPTVYHLDENNVLFAVNVITNSLKKKTRAKDKLISYEIDFEYAFQNGVQRG